MYHENPTKNSNVSKLVRGLLSPPQLTEADPKLRGVTDVLKLWIEQLHPHYDLKYTDVLTLDLVEMTFLAIARVEAHLSRERPPTQCFPFDESKCLWSARPITTEACARPQPTWTQIWHSLNSPDRLESWRKDLAKWTDAFRWHTYVTRPATLKNEAFPFTPFHHIPASDAAVVQLRSFVLENFMATKMSKENPIFKAGRECMKGRHLPLGALSTYCKMNEGEGRRIPNARLAEVNFDLERQKLIKAESEKLVHAEFATFETESQDIWVLLQYATMFEFALRPRVFYFIENYVVFWHQWDHLNTYQLLQKKEEASYPALPLIVSLGVNEWCVMPRSAHSSRKRYRAQGVAHALCIWLALVMKYHNGRTEQGYPVYAGKIIIPLLPDE